MTGPTINAPVDRAPSDPVESHAILARDPVTDVAAVKHILIGWRDLESAYRGRMDPRARARSRDEARTLIEKLETELRNGAAYEGLLFTYSEDPGTNENAHAYHVDASANLEPRFIALSLRLHVGEWGVARTAVGYHLIKRVQ